MREREPNQMPSRAVFFHHSLEAREEPLAVQKSFGSHFTQPTIPCLTATVEIP